MPIEMPLLKSTVNKPRKAVTKARKTNWVHLGVTALPFVLVNVVAISGQLGWAHDHLKGWGIFGQIMFAAALESVAIAIAYHAYLAEITNDTALKLKLASYGFGLLVGFINYSHYATNLHPTTVALVVGIMSASSPWLWGMYSRRVSRNILKQNNLIEEHAIRLGSARWLYHPIRCLIVMSRSTWNGEHYAHKAIEKYNDESERRKLQKELENVSVNGAKEKVEKA